ncbi:flavin-containing monooxygenase [Conexibacter sp. CPCC 206217]|uniref:flavin-containing monooxygenase n=1 Tax=Conexibacter sp. CPCC 206217 TaxID=3064574 RepID=UPI00351C42CD
MPHEHVDVLIVGAGLSGIGAACHLLADSPGKSYAILEARSSSGGTWDLFRYPGIRSDSDMFTLGYAFRPWREAKAIADGPSILRYIRDTAQEHGVEQRIRYHHRVVRAEWSSVQSRWTVEALRTDSGETVHLTCSFLFGCTGYYRYDEGYTPQFPGTERFQGEIVHPQHWPEQLDYSGKRVVVIGSGATAVTLIPAMAPQAAHVTMLQRSPSYVLSLPARDPLADVLRKRLPAKVAYPIVRWKNVLVSSLLFQLSRRTPRLIKALIRKGVARQLPEGYDVDTHFAPTYDPWDQRLCLVPDGDLFKAIRSGDASVVTDRIETFTEHGIRLASGAELEADVIVTATGLNLLVLGGMEIVVDGRPVDLSRTVAYKGMMFSGVPNLALTIGYTNASWTLKGDLVAEYVCRLINHMDAGGYATVTPRLPDAALPTEPFIDLRSGYVLRSIDDLPRQGPATPWRLHQNYPRDVVMLKYGSVEDDAIEFARAAPAPAAPPQPVSAA